MMTKDGLIFEANSLKQGRLQALTRQQLQAQATQNRERRWVSPGLPGRLTTTISASSRRARRVVSSSARVDVESPQGRFRPAGQCSRCKHGNQAALLEAVKSPGRLDRPMAESWLDISRVDQVRGRGGLEPDEALAADQRVASRASDQQGMTEPPMLPGRAGPGLNHVIAAVAAIERNGYGR